MDSDYSKYDLNEDGRVDDEELAKFRTIIEMENQDQKADTQRKMGWVAISGLVIGQAVLMTPLIELERITAIQDIMGTFHYACAGIVGAYFGVTAWMTKNK